MSTMDYDKDKTIYSTELTILVSHLNYGNHMGYDSVLTLVQDARMRWLQEHDMTEADLGSAVGYLVVEAHVYYKAEAFFNDPIQINLYPENVKNRTFELFYEILNLNTNKVVALANTKQIFYDYTNAKVAKKPDNFIAFS